MAQFCDSVSHRTSRARYIVAVTLLLLTACASAPKKPAGEYQWRNDDMDAKVNRGDSTTQEYQHEFLIAKDTCKIQALQIPIPSPSCAARPQQDCSQMGGGVFGGFNQGLCQSQNNAGPICDYSAANAAVESQKEVFASCMELRGWRKVFVPAQSTTATP